MSCHTNPYIDITLKKSGMWYRVTENSLGSSSPGKIDTKEVNERDSSIIIDKVTERGRKQREQNKTLRGIQFLGFAEKNVMRII